MVVVLCIFFIFQGDIIIMIISISIAIIRRMGCIIIVRGDCSHYHEGGVISIIFVRVWPFVIIIMRGMLLLLLLVQVLVV